MTFQGEAGMCRWLHNLQNQCNHEPANDTRGLIGPTTALRYSNRRQHLLEEGTEAMLKDNPFKTLLKDHHLGIVSGYILCMVQSVLPVEM